MNTNLSKRKVLVTGHTGFKGSWLTLWLKIINAEICGISLDPVNINGAFHELNISSICEDIREDINDYESILSIFIEQKPEIIFHLAAQPLVIDSYERPIETFRTNVMGTANILEACRQTPSVKVIIVITTDKCYENCEWIYGYRENDRLGGRDPYSASKAAAELLVNSYRESFFKSQRDIGLATARAGNVIGGGDWAKNRILPDCINSLLCNEPIKVRNPFAVRPWQHVLEPLGGYLNLAHKMLENINLYSEPWNFGPGYEGIKNVEALVQEVVRCWGTGSYSACGHPSENSPYEAGLLTLDIAKARNLLDWNPKLGFSESVKMTVDWYKAQSDGINMVDLSCKQIEDYQNRQYL